MKKSKKSELITFPAGERDDVRERLDSGKTVWTVRVGDECGKFEAGDVVTTEWGTDVNIISVENIRGGIEELKRVYEHFNELTEDMVRELSGYDEMEIITLEASI